MSHKRKIIWICAFLVACVCVALALWHANLLRGTTGYGASESALASENAQEYKDAKHSFSFLYPKGYTSSLTSDPDGNDIIVIEDSEKKTGFQVTVSPFDETESNLTVERIHQDIPDLSIREPQEVLVGANGKGIAFLSDNGNYDGNSREVWFVYKGFLYQISTYASLDPLLKSVFSTWKFLS